MLSTTHPVESKMSEHQHVEHTRESVLAVIPASLHARAEALHRAGFDWNKILALLQALLAIFGPHPEPPPEVASEQK